MAFFVDCPVAAIASAISSSSMSIFVRICNLVCMSIENYTHRSLERKRESTYWGPHDQSPLRPTR
ncbi:hypothetical protein GGE67_004096 [Rhizobium leucaenae]|uniref:Uncharacterized protein n=1 Tax=Rhizobium leucaenae TaxID=29450 RepID=A0A7W6ZXI3_9HYPH|nr:hypothetical protein [Rhizobium leucaenae]MBB6303464.1 hypothetical protein [Rhizobium leucaenae]